MYVGIFYTKKGTYFLNMHWCWK